MANGFPCALIFAFLSTMPVSACSHSEYAAPSSFTVSNEAVVQTVQEALGSGKPEGAAALKGTPTAECDGETSCTINYAVEEPTGIDNGIELIQPTRQIFKTLFADPNFLTGIIIVSGPTTSVGGIKGTSPLFQLSCRRSVVSQINWDNVDAEGLKTLCTYMSDAKGM